MIDMAQSQSPEAWDDTIWRLQVMNGERITAQVTLQIAEGRVQGRAPCNRYFGAALEAYPRFGIGPLAATRMACAEGVLEYAFFRALAVMQLAERAGDTLTLRGKDGLEMRFARADE